MVEVQRLSVMVIHALLHIGVVGSATFHVRQDVSQTLAAVRVVAQLTASSDEGLSLIQLSAQEVPEPIDVPHHKKDKSRDTRDGLVKMANDLADKDAVEISVALAPPDTRGFTGSDIGALLAAMSFAFISIIFIIEVSFCLRQKYPLVYTRQASTLMSPFSWGEGRFTVFRAGQGVTVARVMEQAGFDYGMFLEFSNLAMQLLATIAVPLICVVTPLQAVAARTIPGHVSDGIGQEGFVGLEDTALLAMVGLGGLTPGEPLLYWLHVLTTWGVVLVTERGIFVAMKKFQALRLTWLRELSPPRNATVLVEGIPEGYRTDAMLKLFFDKAFAREVVAIATVVKDTEHLVHLLGDLEGAERCLEEATEHARRRKGRRPTFADLHGITHDSLDFYSLKIQDARAAVDAGRAALADKIQADEETVTTDAGFVTFKTRRDAEVALSMAYISDTGGFVLSVSPDPSDIIWEDLRATNDLQWLSDLCGYGCLLCVFSVAVLLSASLSWADSQDLNMFVARYCPGLELLASGPLVVAFVDGLTANVLLGVFLSFAPLVLAAIFRTFFRLRALSLYQLHFQRWYFIFLVSITVPLALVSAAGQQHWMVTLETLLQNLPVVIVSYANRFYLSFVVLEWVSHFSGFLRAGPLMYFLALRAHYPEDRARALMEPDDQASCGLGARSARLSFTLVLCIVLSSLSPVICVLGFINFYICRAVYGYLLVYVEPRTSELGGSFWHEQLKRLQQGVVVYVIVNALVLRNRGAGGLATVSTLLAGAYACTSYLRFCRSFPLEGLPIEDIVKDPALDTSKQVDKQMCSMAYMQPELI